MCEAGFMNLAIHHLSSPELVSGASAEITGFLACVAVQDGVCCGVQKQNKTKEVLRCVVGAMRR